MILRNNFCDNQLNLKIFAKKEIALASKKIHLYLNLYKIESFTDNSILEGLFLLEFFSGYKTSINNCIYKYKLCNIQLIKHLNNTKNLNRLFTVLRIFYLPSLRRQNILAPHEQISNEKFTYSVDSVNLVPFLPNLYYKWKIPINLFFFFSKKTSNEIFLILFYLGFYFTQEKDIINNFNYIEKKNLLN